MFWRISLENIIDIQSLNFILHVASLFKVSKKIILQVKIFLNWSCCDKTGLGFVETHLKLESQRLTYAGWVGQKMPHRSRVFKTGVLKSKTESLRLDFGT